MDKKPKVRILVVEDNEDDVILLQEFIPESKFLCIEQVVGDGVEALAYLRQEPPFENASHPDLIFMDINMPRMSGLELLEIVKKDPALRYIPVLMLTTSTRDSDIQEAYDLGANSYIKKPTGFPQLLEMIQGLDHYWSMMLLPSQTQ